MDVLNRPGILGIFLRPSADREVRVGTLVRDATGTVTFEVDEQYIRLGRARPIISLAWHGATEEDSLKRLRTRNDKIAHGRHLPPYFDNLLPEGALLDLVEREFGTGTFDNYDVLFRLGGDLPGAVVALREAGEPPPKRTAGEAAREPAASKSISFSLAGVQLKFSMRGDNHRLTAPGADESGDVILKLPSEKYPSLVENEFTSLQLARLAGANVAESRLVDVGSIEGVPEGFLKLGKHALSVSRFDRAPGNIRIHTEDFAQIAGAIDIDKYFRWNQETLMNSVKRFSADPIGDLLEALRRLVIDMMLGNCDGHLKNWSFAYPDGRHARLSPAYDIVSTLTYLPDTMALRFSGTKDPKIVDTGRIRRIAPFLGVDAKLLAREMRETATRALDTWPDAIKDLPAPDNIKNAILSRFGKMALVGEVRPTMIQGHTPDSEPAEKPTSSFNS
ncbi:type II toxin-antitoxin system HipA family toxin [Afipia sp. GAS231]|uniref:type II toxin-antitoxin system HipA family toxin n=1 Tax=Afipia sp. GAS231 TaxID=1882747 RepID=UPI00087D3B15|nr:type II toxin-antitoxin system HipA family toxin [Afipia sp. GAS231]SDO47773.1 serine/threonine-protein kinase HipA [Afipia sp. GAS231]